jgi:hypothetical protein
MSRTSRCLQNAHNIGHMSGVMPDNRRSRSARKFFVPKTKARFSGAGGERGAGPGKCF